MHVLLDRAVGVPDAQAGPRVPARDHRRAAGGRELAQAGQGGLPGPLDVRGQHRRPGPRGRRGLPGAVQHGHRPAAAQRHFDDGGQRLRATARGLDDPCGASLRAGRPPPGTVPAVGRVVEQGQGRGLRPASAVRHPALRQGGGDHGRRCRPVTRRVLLHQDRDDGLPGGDGRGGRGLAQPSPHGRAAVDRPLGRAERDRRAPRRREDRGAGATRVEPGRGGRAHQVPRLLLRRGAQGDRAAQVRAQVRAHRTRGPLRGQDEVEAQGTARGGQTLQDGGRVRVVVHEHAQFVDRHDEPRQRRVRMAATETGIVADPGLCEEGLAAMQLRPDGAQRPQRGRSHVVGLQAHRVGERAQRTERRAALEVQQQERDLGRRVVRRSPQQEGQQEIRLPGSRGARDEQVRPVGGQVHLDDARLVAATGEGHGEPVDGIAGAHLPRWCERAVAVVGGQQAEVHDVVGQLGQPGDQGAVGEAVGGHVLEALLFGRDHDGAPAQVDDGVPRRRRRPGEVVPRPGQIRPGRGRRPRVAADGGPPRSPRRIQCRVLRSRHQQPRAGPARPPGAADSTGLHHERAVGGHRVPQELEHRPPAGPGHIARRPEHDDARLRR